MTQVNVVCVEIEVRVRGVSRVPSVYVYERAVLLCLQKREAKAAKAEEFRRMQVSVREGSVCESVPT